MLFQVLNKQMNLSALKLGKIQLLNGYTNHTTLVSIVESFILWMILQSVSHVNPDEYIFELLMIYKNHYTQQKKTLNKSNRNGIKMSKTPSDAE